MIFTGISRSIVSCQSCQYNSVTFKPFTCISVTCESSLKKSLAKHFEVTQFDSENKYKCEKCYKKTKAKHYVQLCYLPDVVIFHIKRFDLSGKKIRRDLDYPNFIDMSTYSDP